MPIIYYLMVEKINFHLKSKLVKFLSFSVVHREFEIDLMSNTFISVPLTSITLLR